jgi:hypothetical protein
MGNGCSFVTWMYFQNVLYASNKSVLHKVLCAVPTLACLAACVLFGLLYFSGLIHMLVNGTTGTCWVDPNVQASLAGPVVFVGCIMLVWCLLNRERQKEDAATHVTLPEPQVGTAPVTAGDYTSFNDEDAAIVVDPERPERPLERTSLHVTFSDQEATTEKSSGLILAAPPEYEQYETVFYSDESGSEIENDLETNQQLGSLCDD